METFYRNLIIDLYYSVCSYYSEIRFKRMKIFRKSSVRFLIVLLSILIVVEITLFLPQRNIRSNFVNGGSALQIPAVSRHLQFQYFFLNEFS